MLAATAPSLYDMRNLFQVNVEEGRHLWAMVYLLMKHFGRDGREEADLRPLPVHPGLTPDAKTVRACVGTNHRLDENRFTR